ncbi:hypothetical protein SNE40_020896 [Patella caerulea]|uniref:ShKT domain-containing protein n=2 Tax=Patella caerulea TaxID=87958 RepID=A0AAN8G9C9_PATCE
MIMVFHAFTFKMSLILVTFKLPGLEGSCRFPSFLQPPIVTGETKPWNTETWWINLKHDVKWLQKQDIFIEGNSLWRHRERNMKRCDRLGRSVYSKSSFGRCSERELVYNRTCLTSEGYNTFRIIQYNLDRTHKFTCMRFIRRSDNTVQVEEGPLSDTNDPDLCDEEGLVLEEWPWIAPWKITSNVCPIHGGFTFRTISRLTNEDYCENEWRKSTLEVECIVGDGLDFMSPVNSNCNPLLRRGNHKRLSCWSSWKTNEYIFIIAGETGMHPRYCLRFPIKMKGEFTVLIYFSVICPDEQDGKPPSGIQYYELRMKQKDEERCEDDDEDRCKIIEVQGLCAKEQDASHCRRTCGLCQHTTSTRQRCYFDPKLHGKWVLYDIDRIEDVTIERKRAVFSAFGQYYCRETGTNENQYKAVSIFTNGCAPRYTCFEFSRTNNNLLQYRASRSLRHDKEMEEICTFHEDPYPLLDTYRSSYFKNLILSGIKFLWPSYCGIDSTIPFNGTYYGEMCDGTISDWDEDTCTTKGTLTLQSRTCSPLTAPLELQCLAYIMHDTEELQQILITRSMDGKNEFNCWIIKSYIDGGKWPWRVMFKMPTTQCTPIPDTHMDVHRQPRAEFYLGDKDKSKLCKPAQNPDSVIPGVKVTIKPYVGEKEVSTFTKEDQDLELTNTDDFKHEPRSSKNGCHTSVDRSYQLLGIISLCWMGL